MPAFGVYFVKFSSIALCAAALAGSGVGKSGSPAPKSMTSTPARRSLSTAVVTFNVGDPEMRLVRSANLPIWLPHAGPAVRTLLLCCRDLLTQAGLDHVGHQPVH